MPQCPNCNAELLTNSNFCPNCGARLVPASAGPGLPPPEIGIPAPPAQPPEQPRRSRAKVAAAIVIIVLLLAVSVFIVLPSSLEGRPGVVAVTGCPSSQDSAQPPPSPNYDVQEVMAFAQNYPQLEFNVTAVAQCDADGYGPAYLLNGLTNTGYWYQVGINWDWPLQAGGYTPGFGFVSEAWAPGGLTRAPASETFSGTVNPGDTIELSLSFSAGQVLASARDLKTGATGSTSFPARDADDFIGVQAQESQARFSFATQGYFTGLMTEWYHVSASGNGNGQPVTYSGSTEIDSATLGVGEWNFTTAQPSGVFSALANDGNAIDFGAQPDQFQQYTLNGYTISADAYQFVTGV